MERSSWRVHSEPPDAEWFGSRIDDLLSAIANLFAGIRQQMGLPSQVLEVVIAEDLAAVVRSLDGEVIGVRGLKDFSVERVGGVVAGKTMFRDTAHNDAVVILDSALFRSEAPASRVGEILITAHELAHALIGQLRAAGGEPMKPEFLPWLVSRWLARHAVEEFLADQLAEIVLGLSGTITLVDGSQMPLTSTNFVTCEGEFLSAVYQTIGSMITTIDSYRLGHIGLDPMWVTVQTMTGEILNSLAHAQAERDHRTDHRHKREYVADELPSPIDLAWRRICDCVSIQLFEGPKEFVQTEQNALDCAGDAVIDFWRHLGLTFHAVGSGFYISVASPDQA